MNSSYNEIKEELNLNANWGVLGDPPEASHKFDQFKDVAWYDETNDLLVLSKIKGRTNRDLYIAAANAARYAGSEITIERFKRLPESTSIIYFDYV